LGTKLVIVESPSKARKIGAFLGKDYVVEASVGHIRDLPQRAADIPKEYKKIPWAKEGVNIEEDFAPLYVINPDKKAKVSELKDLMKSADELILATDEDREGEAIAWHLIEVLRPKIPIRRMVFHEITPEAIQKALESEVAQQSEELADALHRSFLPDGRPVLETLHQERMIKKLRTSDVIVTPAPNASIRLDELNKMLNDMKQGEEAIKKMAENDASRGLVDPQVKRRAEAEFKAQQAAKAQQPAQNLQAPSQGALSDRDLASNMLAQANRMETEARGMIAEAHRMKKEAEKLDPRVTASVAPPPSTEAPKARRGRPPKVQAVADAAQ